MNKWIFPLFWNSSSQIFSPKNQIWDHEPDKIEGAFTNDYSAHAENMSLTEPTQAFSDTEQSFWCVFWN